MIVAIVLMAIVIVVLVMILISNSKAPAEELDIPLRAPSASIPVSRPVIQPEQSGRPTPDEAPAQGRRYFDRSAEEHSARTPQPSRRRVVSLSRVSGIPDSPPPSRPRVVSGIPDSPPPSRSRVVSGISDSPTALERRLEARTRRSGMSSGSTTVHHFHSSPGDFVDDVVVPVILANSFRDDSYDDTSRNSACNEDDSRRSYSYSEPSTCYEAPSQSESSSWSSGSDSGGCCDSSSSSDSGSCSD